MIEFLSFDFVQRAIIAALISSIAAPPLGVFLILRRMSLMGDALSHAVLPGVAIAFFIFGFSPIALAFGGISTGLIIILFSVWIQKNTQLKEDSSFAALYLLSIACGVSLIAIKGSQSDLMHILFGSPLLTTSETLVVQIFLNLISFIIFIIFYRHFLIEIFDGDYYLSIGGKVGSIQFLFLSLVVFSLVGNFQSHGTLLTMGQLLLPSIISRLWFEKISSMIFASMTISLVGSISGLFISLFNDLPVGPSSLLVWGGIYLSSLFIHPKQGFIFKILKQKHFKS